MSATTTATNPKNYSIDFSNISKLQLPVILEAIHEVLVEAKKYDGVAYGGYVRDILYPGSVHVFNIKSVPIHDVDIWFKTQASADEFMTAMAAHRRINKSHLRSQGYNGNLEGRYPFDCFQFSLVKNADVVSWVDVVVCENIPVNDFSANLLLANLNANNEFIFASARPTDYPVEDIIKAINKKEMILLPELETSMKALPYARNPMLTRIAKFVDRGWKLVENSMMSCTTKTVIDFKFH